MHPLREPMDRQRELLLEGLIDKNAYLPGQLGPPMRVERTERHAVILSGLQTDTFNLVISKRLGAGGLALVEHLCGELKAALLPAAWWTCDGMREDAEVEVLTRHGFVEDEVDAGMLADLGVLPELEPPPGLELCPVERPEEVVAFGHLLASLGDPPDPLVKSFYAQASRLERLEERPLKLFLGLVDGEPVATASVFLSGEGAHVFDISTHRAHRNLGYGSALTHFALAAARRSGAKVGALQASPGGLGLYRRLGFREVCTFRVYSNKRALLGS